MGNVMCSILHVVTLGKSKMPMFSELFAAKKDDKQKEETAEDIIDGVIAKFKKIRKEAKKGESV